MLIITTVMVLGFALVLLAQMGSMADAVVDAIAMYALGGITVLFGLSIALLMYVWVSSCLIVGQLLALR